jgi:hypothetical protein
MKTKPDLYSFFAVGYLIAVTANPFFYVSINYIILGVIITALEMFRRKKNIQKGYVKFTIIFLAIQVGQVITTGVFSPISLLGMHLRFLLAYFVLRTIKYDFFLTSARFVYVMAAVSLIFYIPMIIAPGIETYLRGLAKSIYNPFISEEVINENLIIFQLKNFELKRFLNLGLNSGFYWEPGAHAIFIVLSIMIYSIKEQGFIFSLKNLILVFTLFTTFSTTGYLAFFLFLNIFFIVRSSQSSILKIVIGLMLIYSTYNIISFLPFLGDKIIADIELSDSNNITGSRFQSLINSFNEWRKYPIFGSDRTGGNRSLTIDDYSYQQLHRNNGIGVLLASYGIFFFIYYFVQVIKAIRTNSLFKRKIDYLLFLLIFTLLNFGMPLLTRPFFFAMVLLPFTLNSKISNINIRKIWQKNKNEPQYFYNYSNIQQSKTVK